LLEHGADPNMFMRSSKALAIAVTIGNVEIVRYLIDAGADINYTSSDGVSVLHKAALNGSVSTVKLLLERGAYVNERQVTGTTALMLAVTNGHNKIVEILLDAGADPNIKYESGRTALDYARNNRNSYAISLLEQKKGKSGKEDSRSSDGCFIATVVYSSELSPEVIILKKYRDEFLLSSKLGKFFIELYYFFSPSIAKFLSQQKLLKKFVKLLILNPIVKKLKERG